MSDARFGEGAERALTLVARDAADLAVISALCQDAVVMPADIGWRRRARRLALLVNRFRWEEPDARPPERVRSVLIVSDVRAVQVLGIDRAGEAPLSLLALAWQAGADGTGRLEMTFAGGAAIAAEAEALEVVLRDVTRPYAAPSGRVPRHED